MSFTAAYLLFLARLERTVYCPTHSAVYDVFGRSRAPVVITTSVHAKTLMTNELQV